MVAYLQNPKGSEAFHPIVDFLNASHIKYALIENPKIYISLIQQFWATATARTTDDREVEITTSIDGQVKTITEASLRRYLKLEDSDSITSLPNTKIFEQLALIGYVSDSARLTFQKGYFPQWRPYDSPLLRVHTLGSDEGSLQQNELMDLVTELTDRVEVLENDMQQTKKVYSSAFTKLILIVKNVPVATASATPEVSIAAENLVYIRRSAEKRKDKGKAIMKEDESVQKKTKKKLEQERLGHEEAIRLQEQIDEEERQRIARAAEIAKQLQEEFDRARQVQEVDQNNAFVPKDSEIEKEVMKRLGFDFQQKSSKKRSREDSDEDNTKKQKLKDDAEKEELRDSMDVVPRDDIAIDIESLATKYPIVDWKTHVLTENMMYYQIIKADGSSKNYKIFSKMLDDFDRQDVMDLHRLVQERYDTTSPEGYDLLLWGDLKIIFEPNEKEEIWKNQHDYNLISWRLFDSCGIHMLLMHTGIAIHMMIEKNISYYEMAFKDV
ncbi:hypothetical protein Tco_0520808 [Tanacetum coccineum]